jgi:cadmium resistance transport/sequestration family protein
MNWLLKAFATGVITFAATNIDDIFVLMLFFSQTGNRLRAWHVVAGQYIGFTALVAVSLLGFLVGLAIPQHWIGLFGLLPIIIGVRHWLNRKYEAEKENEEKEQVRRSSSDGVIAALLSVATVTAANGGDNIGIYTPLFAVSTLQKLLILLTVFYILIALWCWLGYLLSKQPQVAYTLTNYGHIVVPVVLIGLGIYILFESGTLMWLLSLRTF